MRMTWLLVLPSLLGSGGAGAQEAPTRAFQDAYAASFYQFDACGDGVAGRIYRKALSDKVRRCAFTPEARQHFQAWSTAQRKRSGEAMTKLIEDNGGLPIRLQGMTRTCREQIDSPEYRAVRDRLDAYAAGRTAPDAVVPQPCDAASIAP